MVNQKKSISVIGTKDGSTTLFSDQFSQHYHNPNGAVAESRHVFFDVPKIAERLKSSKQFTLFEMGFGTGLNLILMKDYLEESGSDCSVVFRSVEAFPINIETVGELDFGKNLKKHNPIENLTKIFGNLKPGLNRFEISNQLTLELFYGTFKEMPDPDCVVDAFFHDPFSPEVNSELWTTDVFKRLASFAKKDAVLSTYCAASVARAAMAVAGWKIAKSQGALGKREMTIASLDENRLKGFKQVNAKRLIERFQSGDFKR